MSWGFTWSCSTITDIILMKALTHAVIERGPLSGFLGSGCLVGLINGTQLNEFSLHNLFYCFSFHRSMQGESIG